MILRLPTVPLSSYDPVWHHIVKNKSMLSNPENACLAQPDNMNRTSTLAEPYDDAQKTDGGVLVCSRIPISNTLKFETFHHIKRSSSPLAPLRKEDKFFGVLSLHNKIVSLPVPTDTGVCSIKVAVPCEKDILGISTKEEFDSIKPKTRQPTRISVLPCVGVPTECMLEVSKQADSGHGFELFMIFKDYFQNSIVPFAEASTENARAEILSIFVKTLQTLWAFCHSSEMSLPSHTDVVSLRSLHPDPFYWNTLYDQSKLTLGPRAPNQNNDGLVESLAKTQSELTSLSANHQQLLSKFLDVNNSASSGSKTSWKNRILEPSHKALLRMQASSPLIPDDGLPDTPPKVFVDFLEASDSHKTQHVLNFCREQNMHVHVSKRLLTNLSVAQLIGCDTNGAPSFSVFQFFPPHNISNSVAEISVTEEQLRQNNGYTEAQIESLCGKEMFSIPSSKGQLISQIKNMCGFICFIAGKNSCFHLMCKKNTCDYLSQNLVKVGLIQSLDNSFFGKLLAYIDACVQAFLISIFDSKDMSGVNFDALSFPLIRSHVENLGAKISSDVPPAVAKDAFSANKRALKMLGQDKNHDGSNKKRKNERSKGATNENPNSEWLVEKKHFFAFNKRLRSCPKMNGKDICCKFHVLGHCPLGNDCTRSDSHCPLPGDTESAFSSWCKEVKDSL